EKHGRAGAHFADFPFDHHLAGPGKDVDQLFAVRMGVSGADSLARRYANHAEGEFARLQRLRVHEPAHRATWLFHLRHIGFVNDSHDPRVSVCSIEVARWAASTP